MRIVKEGYQFIIVPLILGLVFLIAGRGIILIAMVTLCVLVSLFCLYFFRDPEIEITRGDNLILSPCNGMVLEVSENETEKVIRVFLSVLDVHLQRSPVPGKVKSVEYKSGKFLKAIEPQAHIVNEQNIITIENESGKYLVKQIAGILARRCVSWVKPGDVLKPGDKIGMIKFSSQVDLHIPRNTDIKVSRGDKVVSGVTIFATLNK
ncbi:phosphatidylserine decarboxylase proenzyme [Endomicrobiia bacterium]|uniref:Phosphatidylserine decarboxylase n=1 Tax=Endomicrobium trichonymphae TaxID=1408204 RepID=B1GZY2_ENDTX|nr:phosphatidylserine decarboxylase [Candidatus Endomicrobium trichonymphae]GHT05845.1 phosphatidylserine decarboxylase proenzyme [Endomicrobiia bacterium]BAG13814.1 phosphatidylserine decarboxylase [Candidatus Endomicrobium trichonymphae]BAV58884.1 phosphatidylserine decarboxylase [Candidatus Endomicrobium trichonymphae]GHT08595.1 phosphatidylserine decarboxylase proenzyme [Endomicrobiia bacterium]GHT11706.1 phosphatidylserine decarboxylase proenzyme [Endomicrobiia bacterium]